MKKYFKILQKLLAQFTNFFEKFLKFSIALYINNGRYKAWRFIPI